MAEQASTQNQNTKPPGEQVTGQSEPTAESAMLDVKQVAEMLQCSTRHVYRLSDAGRMPRPLKLGQLCRWRRASLVEWLNANCPNCRALKGGAR